MQDYLRSSTLMLLILEIIKQPEWGNEVVKVQALQQTWLLYWALSTVLSVFIVRHKLWYMITETTQLANTML